MTASFFTTLVVVEDMKVCGIVERSHEAMEAILAVDIK
jgi:hypothetical protein